LPEELKERLLKSRRSQRRIATMLEADQDSIAIIAGTTTDPLKQARYRVAHTMMAAIIDECRSIADKVDEVLRTDEISEDQWMSLATRLQNVAVKFNATVVELGTVREADLGLLLDRQPRKSDP
jgi:hypothetical protein